MQNSETNNITLVLLIVLFVIFLFFKLGKKQILKYENTPYENMLSARTIFMLIVGIILLTLTLLN